MSMDQEAQVSNIELAADYKGSTGGAVVRHTIIFFVLMFIWEMANRTGFSNPLLLPRPTDVVTMQLEKMGMEKVLRDHVFTSGQAALIYLKKLYTTKIFFHIHFLLY